MTYRSLNEKDVILGHLYYLLQHFGLTLVELGMILDQIGVHLMDLLLLVGFVGLWVQVRGIAEVGEARLDGATICIKQLVFVLQRQSRVGQDRCHPRELHRLQRSEFSKACQERLKVIAVPCENLVPVCLLCSVTSALELACLFSIKPYLDVVLSPRVRACHIPEDHASL